MLHIERLSRAYRVRRLTEEDTAQILALSDPALAERLSAFCAAQTASVAETVED